MSGPVYEHFVGDNCSPPHPAARGARPDLTPAQEALIAPDPPAEPGLREALERLVNALDNMAVDRPLAQARAALAAAPQPALDVERLARAIRAIGPRDPTVTSPARQTEIADLIAAEYERLGGEGT